MSDFVVMLSLGPVQGFIAAARRSRDLWSGSWLLSEISKAAAAELQAGGARLVFPAPGSDLRPDSALSVGNKVQVVVMGADEAAVRARVEAAKQAAGQRFRSIADSARQRLGEGDALRDALWQVQADDYVEAYGAWACIGPAGYGAAVALATRALAARKATRDFRASARDAFAAPGYGLPKSSLDGARETVLQEGRQARGLRRKLGLSRSEQLDCAGVVKRLGGRIDQFTPFTRVAAHAWIESLSDSDVAALARVYEGLVDEGLATRVAGNADCFARFPYDAQLLYRSRLDAALRDAVADSDSGAAEALQALRDALKGVWYRSGEPCTYGVVLLADGDRMGALLGELREQPDHVRVTEALSCFAGSIRARIREFAGHAIYAGGDDVLAFVPLHNAFAAAAALQADFAGALQPVARDLKARSLPTLSVGLAVGHIMEPLGNLRALAGSAEKLAKGDDCAEAYRRNALGIVLKVRSGGLVRLRLRWDDPAALADFAYWQRCYSPDTRRLPSRLAYDARQVHARTAFALAQEGGWVGIQQAEFARLLARARTEAGVPLDETMKIRLREAVASRQGGLAALADELIAARWLAARTSRDIGEE